MPCPCEPYLEHCCNIQAAEFAMSCSSTNRKVSRGVFVFQDPVTGSAHAVIGPWWAEQLGKTSLRARQCSKRGGELNLKIEGSRVKISGSTAIVSKGTLYLPKSSAA